LIAIIYIDVFYGDTNYFHITNHEAEQQYEEFNLFLKEIIITNSKQQLIEDFVQQKKLKKEDYSNITNYCYMNFDETCKHYTGLDWFIHIKNIDVFNELSSILEFNEVEYSDDSD